MKRLAIVLLTLALAGPVALAQNFILQKTSQPAPAPAAEGGDDVFVPISKYIAAGNAEALSAWFADNLEIAVLAKENGRLSRPSSTTLRHAVSTSPTRPAGPT